MVARRLLAEPSDFQSFMLELIADYTANLLATSVGEAARPIRDDYHAQVVALRDVISIAVARAQALDNYEAQFSANPDID